MDATAHWQRVWAGSKPEQLSWHEQDPATSLRLIGLIAPRRDSRIIDVGGGASLLAGRLIDLGYTEVTVVDLSEAALGAARERLGDRERDVTWVAADARKLSLSHPVDVWHDRAVFHFLTEPDDKAAYLRSLRANLAVGGHLVIATFGPEGPERCSGLPVERYDAARLSGLLGPEFEEVSSFQTRHVTPSGAVQQFTYAAFRRRG